MFGDYGIEWTFKKLRKTSTMWVLPWGTHIVWGISCDVYDVINMIWGHMFICKRNEQSQVVMLS